jgi:hypothetical protein
LELAAAFCAGIAGALTDSVSGEVVSSAFVSGDVVLVVSSAFFAAFLAFDFAGLFEKPDGTSKSARTASTTPLMKNRHMNSNLHSYLDCPKLGILRHEKSSTCFSVPGAHCQITPCLSRVPLILKRRTLYIEETQYNSIFRCIPLTAKGLTRYRPCAPSPTKTLTGHPQDLDII